MNTARIDAGLLYAYNFTQMKILEVKDIIRLESPIYYRKKYTASAVVQFLHKTEEKPIEFTVEMEPTGKKHVKVSLLQHIEYPLLPIVTALKHTISELEKAGRLP
ncbi:MAG: hypothetical protein SNJ56_05440 [Termitinemataceae bacterium]